MNLSDYPPDWKAIALEVKNDANWTCEECGRPCRRPGVPWVDFEAWLLTEVKDAWYQHCDKPQRFTLTVAHLDHNPQNCDRSNLKALCSGCHLRYDAAHHARNAAATRMRKAGREQLSLFTG